MSGVITEFTASFDNLDLSTVMVVLNALPVAAFLLDAEKIHCNRAATELTGYDSRDLPSVSSFFSILFGQEIDVISRLLNANCDEDKVSPCVVSMICKDGTHKTVRVSSSGSQRLLCCLQEATGTQASECERPVDRKYIQSQALLQSLVDSVPFDFFAIDGAGRYTLLSSKTANIWGDVVGKTVEDFAAGTCFEKYVPRWLENNRRALAGEVIQGEFLYELQGEEHVVQEIIGPIRDAQQRIIGTFGINLDISSQKQIQQALMESEERYRRLSGLTSDYVYCCRRSGQSRYRVMWLGGAIEEITGYSEAEVFDKGCWISFVHPADRERVASRMVGLRGGGSSTDEFRIVCKNGDIRWIRESCRCEAGDEPDELLLFGAAQNITESKQVELALRNKEEIFRLFLEHSPGYVVFKDENQRIIRLSKNFESVFDRPLSEVLGKTAAEILPPEVAEAIRLDDLKVLREGKPSQREEKVNGRFYSSLRFPIPQDNKPSLIAAIKIDITARKEAEDALSRLNELLDRRVAERTAQLEAAILEQESFSYSVSHDLRAPLRHINSFSAIVLEDYAEMLPPEGRDYLQRICQATKRMGVLIDNLLAMSRVTRTLLNRSRVNLSEIVSTLALMLKEIDPDRAVEFVIAPDLFANCDKGLVQQLLQNLLGNAWKYTAKKTAACIEFGAIPAKEGNVFFVRDNGAGFDMIYKDKLFIPFQRLHGAEYEGNGIGLATVQRIIQHHGGTIWAEGKEGAGASFYFTLP